MSIAHDRGYIESGQRLVEASRREWSHRALLAAAQSAGIPASGGQAVPTVEGIEGSVDPPGSYLSDEFWYLRKDGN